MKVEEVIRKMNIFGASNEPFIFAFDYELENGFIYDNPLEQKNIFWRIGNCGNYNLLDRDKGMKGTFFKSIPVAKSSYEHKFNSVHEQLMAGNSFLLNLTIKTPIMTDYSLNEIFSRSNAQYNILFPEKFVCFSPETFVRIKEGKIYSYPMKGTIKDDEPDAENIILSSYKESSEHYTIVDFIRNDLAMVSNSVKVERLRYIDRLCTTNGNILQVSSEISGMLDDNWHERIGNIIYRLLPAGSISGAPKESSVNIIQNAEKENRGYYTGIFGYYDGKELDSAVMIRFIENDCGKLFFRSGGGITINSDMESEYNEVTDKAYLPF